METEMPLCKNCDSKMVGPYCHQCGQRASIHKVTFGETFQDVMTILFSVEGPLLRTLTLLVKNPGKLFRDYLKGQRKSYYKPVAFFILVSVIYLIIRSLIDYSPFQNNTINVSDESERQLLMEARDFMLLYIDKFLFIFVFVLSLLSKLFFYRKQSLAEFTAISFYIIGVYTLFTTLNMFYVQYINANLQYWVILFMAMYFTFAMITFFEQHQLRVGIKAFILFFISTITYGLTAFAISFAIVWLKH